MPPSSSSTMNEGDNNDGHLENGQRGQSKKVIKRSAFRALVEDFGPLWFTWSMNSGLLGLLIRQHPYRFNGINVLADIFFVFDLVTFITFSSIFLVRMAMYGKQMFQEITSDVMQLTLLACWPIAWLTLCELIAVVISPTVSWGGRWATILAYSMWWFAVLWTMLTLMFAFVVLSKGNGGGQADGKEQIMPTTVIIPAVAVTTLALTGALVVSYGNGATAAMAVPVIITGVCLVGIGIVMGTLLVVLLWRAFFVSGWPAPEQTASFFVLIGPMGQSAAALLAIGTASSVPGVNTQTSFFAEYNHGQFLTASTTSSFPTVTTILALLLLGNAALFFFFSFYAMLERAFQKQLKWNMTWNSIIFPTGTMTTTTTLLAKSLDSAFFRVVTAVQLIFLVALFLFNLGMTMMQVFKGELLISREKEIDVQEESEKDK